MTCKPRPISGNLPFDAIAKDYNRYCGRIVGNSSGLFLQPETIAFVERVVADGGTVEDVAFLNSFIVDAKANNYFGDIVLAGCSSWGVKGGATASDLYSITGAGFDLAQVVGASQPAIALNNLNGKSRLIYDGVDDLLAATFAFNQPETVVMMGFQQITWTGGDRLFDGGTSSSMQAAQAGTSPRVDISAGAAIIVNNLPVGADAHIRALFNSTSSAFQKDNEAETTGDAGGINAGGLTVGARATATSHANIAHGAIVLLNSAFDGNYAAKMTALYSFSKSVYGTA